MDGQALASEDRGRAVVQAVSGDFPTPEGSAFRHSARSLA